MFQKISGIQVSLFRRQSKICVCFFFIFLCVLPDEIYFPKRILRILVPRTGRLFQIPDSKLRVLRDSFPCQIQFPQTVGCQIMVPNIIMMILMGLL